MSGTLVFSNWVSWCSSVVFCFFGNSFLIRLAMLDADKRQTRLNPARKPAEAEEKFGRVGSLWLLIHSGVRTCSDSSRVDKPDGQQQWHIFPSFGSQYLFSRSCVEFRFVVYMQS